jgi:hypothetical protein
VHGRRRQRAVPPSGLFQREESMHASLHLLLALGAALLTAASAGAAPESAPAPSGYLCCNMYTDGKWISDINYRDSGQRMLPLGTAVKGTGYARYRVLVDIDGKPQAIGNDYSRKIEMGQFAQRYIVAEDPTAKLAAAPQKIRTAITSGRVTLGMSREQVTMALGYPVESENPDPKAAVWRYWLDFESEVRVIFGDDALVKAVELDRAAGRHLVVLD